MKLHLSKLVECHNFIELMPILEENKFLKSMTSAHS